MLTLNCAVLAFEIHPFDMSIDIKASDIAAWWGAGLATIVLVWDVLKWRKARARLIISAKPDMESFEPAAGGLQGDKLIHVEVVNRGGATTTLKLLIVRFWSGRLARLLRRKPVVQGVILRPDTSQPLPYKLEPGGRWSGTIDQQDIENKSGGIRGLLECSFSHSQADKPSYVLLWLPSK
jgi:hypothetical protein